MPESLASLLAVVSGGLLTIMGGYFSTVMIERQRFERAQRNLAPAFRGEVSAILQLIADRDYVARFTDVIAGIEKSGEPFYMPFRIRYQYDSVFRTNADKIGTLANPLPELLAIFYTRMASVLEDFGSLGDGTYAALPTPHLLRIYRSTVSALNGTQEAGREIVAKIDELYGNTGCPIRRPL